MVASGHFEFWLLQNAAAIFARVMGAHFFSKYPKELKSNVKLIMLSVVTETSDITQLQGPLTRYVQFRVAHAQGMPGTDSPPPTSKETAS